MTVTLCGSFHDGGVYAGTDNGDNTVMDFDTGLMSLKLVGLGGVQQPNVPDADDRFDWTTALQIAARIKG